MTFVIPPKLHYYIIGEAIIETLKQSEEFDYELYKEIKIRIFLDRCIPR